jgi:hypothetical protein
VIGVTSVYFSVVNFMHLIDESVYLMGLYCY